jgi:mannosyl-3-phosphoglycerate phosphatase
MSLIINNMFNIYGKFYANGAEGNLGMKVDLADIRLLIFTDLNDTLLDKNHDFSPANEALALVKAKRIPLILCSSKTRGQAEIYRKRLGINYPLIVENGGAIFFPPGSFPPGRLPAGVKRLEGEFVLEFTRPAESLLPDLKASADKVGADIETIFDMSVDRVREITGMSVEEAELCRKRDYTVYFLCHSNKEGLFEELQRRGLKPTWGSYFCHLGASNYKGRAVHHLTALYREMGIWKLKTAGFGDNMNDLTLLQNVHYPFLVERPGGGYAKGVEVEGLEKLDGIGPVGWNRGVIELIERIMD